MCFMILLFYYVTKISAPFKLRRVSQIKSIIMSLLIKKKKNKELTMFIEL